MKLTISEAYEVLGVSSDTEEAEVRTAYKKLALECHPDKNLHDPSATVSLGSSQIKSQADIT
jgi:curved DNA-binding protein CbpA